MQKYPKAPMTQFFFIFSYHMNIVNKGGIKAKMEIFVKNGFASASLCRWPFKKDNFPPDQVILRLLERIYPGDIQGKNLAMRI